MKNYENKFIECRQSISCLTSKILSEIEKLQNNHENCSGEPAHTTFASVTRPIKSRIIISNKTRVQKLKVKIDHVEQDALSKTIIVQCVSNSIDSLLENNFQDMEYSISGIKSAITNEINSFITQTLSENDITELSVFGRTSKHLKIALASANMKPSILQGARLNHPTNVYINEYLTQKRLALLSNFVSSKKIILQLVQCTPEMVQSTTNSTLIKISSM